MTTSRDTVRVRFAPSPTGFLHIGGVRTALFNWLYARKTGGKFLLRIEDTDLDRSEQRYTDDIQESMRWLGLDWDEEPIFQSKRLDVYRQKAEALIEQGLAYRCTCTEEDVEKMRVVAEAKGLRPKYDGSCREKKIPENPGVSFVIRAKLPTTGSVSFDDLIRGPISFENFDLDDFVLIRSNGAPTYNLSVVIDDAESKISHVVRGDDHINNTPKQIHLYRFLGVEPPKFAHLAMILGNDKKKLSKRHGAVSANVYREEGYLPEAVLNFLARLGWSHGDQEEFTVAEMTQLFDFGAVQTSPAVFNTEKLQWLNGVYIRKSSVERIRDLLISNHSAAFTQEGAKELQVSVALTRLELLRAKAKTLKDFVEPMNAFAQKSFEAPPTWEGLKAAAQPETKAKVIELIHSWLAESSQKVLTASGGSKSVRPSEVNIFAADLESVFKARVESSGLKLGEVAPVLRRFVLGAKINAGLFESIVTLPWGWVEERVGSLK